jgi:hypothetical protein
VTGTEKDYTTRSRFAFFTKEYLGERIRKSEMGGACGTCGVQQRCI